MHKPLSECDNAGGILTFFFCCEIIGSLWTVAGHLIL